MTATASVPGMFPQIITLRAEIITRLQSEVIELSNFIAARPQTDTEYLVKRIAAITKVIDEQSKRLAEVTGYHEAILLIDLIEMTAEYDNADYLGTKMVTELIYSYVEEIQHYCHD